MIDETTKNCSDLLDMILEWRRIYQDVIDIDDYPAVKHVSEYFVNERLENGGTVGKPEGHNIYIYIYAFSRRFYPKRLTLHSRYSFYILSALAFPGNRTHDLGVASAMLYQLSYRKTNKIFVVPSRGGKGSFPLIPLPDADEIVGAA